MPPCRVPAFLDSVASLATVMGHGDDISRPPTSESEDAQESSSNISRRSSATLAHPVLMSSCSPNPRVSQITPGALIPVRSTGPGGRVGAGRWRRQLASSRVTRRHNGGLPRRAEQQGVGPQGASQVDAWSSASAYLQNASATKIQATKIHGSAIRLEPRFLWRYDSPS